jgi:hypothetical protein
MTEAKKSTSTSPEPISRAFACPSTESPSSNVSHQSEPQTLSRPLSLLFDTDELLERIATVQQENLKRFDDDIDILKSYLKTQHAPKAAIEVLESVTVEQHVSWKKAIKKIEEILEK